MRARPSALPIVPLSLASLAVVAMGPALEAGFVHDDQPQLLGNPLLRDLRHLPTLWSTGVWAGAGSGSSWYRPLMTTSVALQHAIFGFQPVAMHALQLGLYGLVVALAAALIRSSVRNPRFALAAGALFAVHPLNAEAAVWISGSPELLAGAGGLAALLFHRRALERASQASGGAGRLRAAESVCLALALFGKESAVVFLPVMAALDRAVGASFAPRELLARYAGIAAACALYGLLRILALGGLARGLAPAFDPAGFLGFFGQGALRVVWPRGLSLTPLPPVDAQVFFGTLLLLAASGASIWLWQRRSIALVPLVLGMLQLAIASLAATRLGELADRYLLQLTLASAWGLALLLDRGVAPRRAGRAAGVALAVGLLALPLGLGAWSQARVFRSNASLWSHAYASNPQSLRASLNLAGAYLDAERPGDAIPLLEQAERLAPGDRQVAINRAIAAHQLGRAEVARRELEGLLAGPDQDDPRVHTLLGHLALERSDAESAARHYRRATDAHPLGAEAWAGLALARAAIGDREAAALAAERALGLDPGVQNGEALRRLLPLP